MPVRNHRIDKYHISSVPSVGDGIELMMWINYIISRGLNARD